MIKVYPFAQAPADLQALASQGGDEDWIVVVPKSLVTLLEYGNPHWIDTTDSCHEPVQITLPNGDVLFVGCH